MPLCGVDEAPVVVGVGADACHIAVAAEEFDPRGTAAAGAHTAQRPADVPDLVALETLPGSGSAAEDQSPRFTGSYRPVLLEVEDLQGVQVGQHVMDGALGLLALVRQRPQIGAAVRGRADHLDAEVLGEDAALLGGEVLAPVVHLPNPAVGAQCLALGVEELPEVGRHAEEGVGPVAHQGFRDRGEVGARGQRDLSGVQPLQYGEEADEAAVQAAAVEEVRGAVACRVEPGVEQAVRGGAHLGVVVGVGEDRECGRACAAAAAEVQVGVFGGQAPQLLLDACLVEQRAGGRGRLHGRSHEVVQAGGGGETLVGLYGDPPAVSLQRVDAVVGFTVVGVEHGAHRGHTRDTCGDGGAAELRHVRAGAGDRRGLEVAPHGSQGGDHVVAGQRLHPDAAVERRGGHCGTGVGEDAPGTVLGGDDPGQAEVLFEPGDEFGVGDLGVLGDVEPGERRLVGDFGQPRREAVREGEDLFPVVGVEVDDLRTGTRLLVEEADVRGERGLDGGVAPGVAGQVREGDLVAPLDQSAAGRCERGDAGHGVLAAPDRDGVGRGAQGLKPCAAAGGEAQGDDPAGEDAGLVGGGELGEQTRGERRVGAARLQDVEVAGQQSLDDAQRSHARRVARCDVHDEADGRPRLVDGLPRVGPGEPLRVQSAQFAAELALQRRAADGLGQLGEQGSRLLRFRAALGEAVRQPGVNRVAGGAQRLGEPVAGAQHDVGGQLLRHRALGEGGQVGEELGDLRVVDERALPQVESAGRSGGRCAGHAIPFRSSAAATAQLRLRLTPALPWTVNHGVGWAQPHSSPGCSEARSPMSTLCAGTEVMYGETRWR